MTTLEKINLEKENVYLNIHEAPYHLTTSIERQNWAQQQKPCFNNEILQFWKLYCSRLPKEKKCILNIKEEQNERRRFIRYPITTLTIEDTSKTQTIGGIWIDNVKANKLKERTADIHIKVSQDKRKFAYPLFENFLNSAKEKYTYITTEWGTRNLENDPTSFLKNNNFEIIKKLQYTQGKLKL